MILKNLKALLISRLAKIVALELGIHVCGQILFDTKRTDFMNLATEFGSLWQNVLGFNLKCLVGGRIEKLKDTSLAITRCLIVRETSFGRLTAFSFHN